MAGESLRIKGDIVANEDLRFEGHIEGTISVPGHTLFVGPQARITADVQAKAVVVAGTLTGTVMARERFELQAQGTMEGTLDARVAARPRARRCAPARQDHHAGPQEVGGRPREGAGGARALRGLGPTHPS
jgi:hypothetical protein